ncbi:MAG TPA: VOC family protein [Caulobacteraceae bacterium]|jgi:catechol 2,3-dioxygenase-like lactoylglutathione lyase family enzyme
MIRIRLTSICVPDQERAEAFYAGKLGFQVKRNIHMGPVRAPAAT